MKRHTPGPWHNDGYRIYAPTRAKDKRNGRIIVEYKHVTDFNYADSHLIAAAPELLEALRYFAGLVDCPEGYEGCGESDSGPYCTTHFDNYRHQDEVKRAQAAIAKAEGR